MPKYRGIRVSDLSNEELEKDLSIETVEAVYSVSSVLSDQYDQTGSNDPDWDYSDGRELKRQLVYRALLVLTASILSNEVERTIRKRTDKGGKSC